jgi:hypothetical protein
MFIKYMCNGKGCCKGGMCTVSFIAKILLIIGGVNWGLVGIGMLMNKDWNVVNMLLGSWPIVEAIVYILVGVAAVCKIFGCCCKKCKDSCVDDKVEASM